MNDEIQNKSLDLERFNLEIAIQGAKDLVEVTKQIISNEENKEKYRNLEVEAYKKLAAVDVAQANALVEAEREKISEELLKGSIRLMKPNCSPLCVILIQKFTRQLSLARQNNNAWRQKEQNNCLKLKI